jgi:ribonuclease III
MADDDILLRLEETIGYHFHDRKLLELALSHRSIGQPNNERLEFLGDAVISFLVADYLFVDEEDNESVLTRKRSLLTDRIALIKVGERIGLKDYLIIGPSMKGRTSQKMTSDSVEALMGAVFKDGGMEEAYFVLKRILFNRAMLEEVLGRVDWITRLKEWCDSHRGIQPKYLTLEEWDVNREERTFIAWLTLEGLNENGAGPTKKEAMAEAARKMMASLSQE